ncbi:MAG: glycosyltransferase [Bacilli bacterium]|nr:glycosyltransferase [Bacilli bacterium]
MVKVLHITNYYYPHVGGIETATRDIVNALKSSGQYEQRVICFGDGPHIVDDVRITRVPYAFKFRSQPISLSYRRKLRELVTKFAPEIVLIHTPNPLVEFYFQHIDFRGKVIVYHHLDIWRQKILKHLVKPIEYRTKRRADVILCHSQQYVDGSKELQHFKEKVKIIPLCYKESDFVLDEKQQEEVAKIKKRYRGKTLLFFSGRHTPTKGLNLALKAVKNMDNVLFLVGRVGEINRHLEHAIDRGGPNVIYLGQLDREQYIKYLHACDFYLFPSIAKNEAFPITLIEVIALGKSPITFTIPGSGVNYISKGEETGIECPNKDVTAFRDAINVLRSNKALRNRYAENGMARAKELFNYQQFANAFTKLFSEISKTI